MCAAKVSVTGAQLPEPQSRSLQPWADSHSSFPWPRHHCYCCLWLQYHYRLFLWSLRQSLLFQLLFELGKNWRFTSPLLLLLNLPPSARSDPKSPDTCRLQNLSTLQCSAEHTSVRMRAENKYEITSLRGYKAVTPHGLNMVETLLHIPWKVLWKQQ